MSLMGESDTKYGARLRRVGGRLLKKERARLTDLFNIGESQMLDALRERTAGYDRALDQVGLMGGASRRAALELGQQAQGAAQSSAISRGFSGASTTGAAGQIASQTARNIAIINEQMGRLYTSLSVGRGEASAAGRTGLADLALRRFGAEKESWFDPKFNLAMGTRAQKSGFMQKFNAFKDQLFHVPQGAADIAAAVMKFM
jgi:hypothetical protein